METQYDVDYVVMRLAEVMLNYAETANETGDINTAIDILTQIRKRAGIEAGLDGKYGITAASREDIREAILLERSIEFCFEGHRFWDLRRWRKAHITLNGIRVTGHKIEPNGTGFTYQVVPADNLDRSFSSRLYYLPIPEGEIQVNLALTQIKGW